MQTALIRVTYIQRRPSHGEHYSLERLFANMRSALPPSIDARVVILPYRSTGVWRRVANAMYALLQKGDVIHVTGDVNYVAIPMWWRCVVLTIHDCGHRRRNCWRQWLFELIWLRAPLSSARAVTCGAEAVVRELRALSHRPVEMIPDCVDPMFLPAERKPHKLPRVLQVGTGANKNVLRLISALKGMECELHIVGPMNERIRSSLLDARITYKQSEGLSDSEMVKAYEDTDIVAFVSTYEGFGLPILEAQAVGRAVVTSRIAPLVDTAGEGAILVDPESITEIRSAVTRLLYDDHLRQTIVERGTINVARFGADAMASAYASLYRSLLGRQDVLSRNNERTTNEHSARHP